MKFDKGKSLQHRAHRLIPGGCHTYAKGDDQFPEASPPFIARGLGCHVWDLDDNEFIEYGMGLRSVTLGHAYPAIVEAAHRQMRLGNNFTRPASIELEYAERLLALVPGADQVKFAKDGSTVTTAAVKLARAHTGRDYVALCQDHPFFSYNDWFIGTTQVSGGVPGWATEKSLGFRYNDPGSLRALFDQFPDQIAGVILEPERDVPPEAGFLAEVREICTENGALLIFDEMITGFRWDLGGAQGIYNVVPDLSTFGKAIANGFAVSALLGRREFMELGGLSHTKERVFLLSTTHGAETPALAAAIATLSEYLEHDVIEQLDAKGRALQRGVQQVIDRHALAQHVTLSGRPCNLAFGTRDADRAPSQPFRTLLLQELIKNGILAPSLVISFSHQADDIEKTVDAFDSALVTYKQALESGVDSLLVGPSVKPVYRQFN